MYLMSNRSYRPFGAYDDQPSSCTEVDETKAFVGERYDMDAELYYLNAQLTWTRLWECSARPNTMIEQNRISVEAMVQAASYAQSRAA